MMKRVQRKTRKERFSQSHSYKTQKAEVAERLGVYSGLTTSAVALRCARLHAIHSLRSDEAQQVDRSNQHFWCYKGF